MFRFDGCLALAFLLAGNVAANESLSPQQRTEVAAMILADRANVRRAVLDELCAEFEQQGDVPEACRETVAAAPTEHSADSVTGGDLEDAESGASAPGKAFSPEYFFGNTPRGLIDSNVDRGEDLRRFEVSASTASSSAAVRFGRTVSDGNAKHLTFTTMSATFSAPLNKDDDFTNLGTLDGFTNSSALALRYSKLVVGGPRTPRLADGTPSQAMLDVYAQAGLDPDEHYDLNLVKEALEKKGMLSLYPAFEALYWNPASRRWIYGASAKVGHEKFNYLGLGSLESRSQREVPWSLGVFGGFIPRADADLYLGAGLEYQNAFKAAKSRTTCPSETAGDVLECVTGNYGPPSKSEALLLSVEARRAFRRFGASLKVTHDLRSSDTGIDLPIFFFNDVSAGLSSGIRFGWTNTDQFSFGVFVGGAFELDKAD